MTIVATPLYSTWRQFVVRDDAGHGFPREVMRDDVAVMLHPREGPPIQVADDSVRVRRSVKPVSLSIIVDRSASMRGMTDATIACVRECILRLRSGDRIRIATFASNQRSTNGYITVEEYKTAAVVRHVRLLLRRDAGQPWLQPEDAARLASMSPGQRAALDVTEIARLTRGLSADTWIAIQRAALDEILAGEFRNGGATLGGHVFDDAMQALLQPSGAGKFVAALDSNPGLLIVTDDPLALPLDGLASAVLRALLVQAVVLSPPGAAEIKLPGYGTSARLREDSASAAAERFVGSLRDVYELEADVPDLQFTRPGGVQVTLRGAREWRVVVPAECLPSRDAVLASLETEASSPRSSARRWDTESPSAREVLAAIASFRVAN